MHLVYSFDANAATASSAAAAAMRNKVYINGEQITLNFTGYAGGGNALAWANATKSNIGSYDAGWSGHMTDIYFIDGYTLSPENFGEYKNGVWIPKEYAGPPPLITDSSDSNHAVTLSLIHI